jgi:hypothetical protein
MRLDATHSLITAHFSQCFTIFSRDGEQIRFRFCNIGLAQPSCFLSPESLKSLALAKSLIIQSIKFHRCGVKNGMQPISIVWL